jgi:hypothetical protein
MWLQELVVEPIRKESFCVPLGASSHWVVGCMSY